MVFPGAGPLRQLNSTPPTEPGITKAQAAEDHRQYWEGVALFQPEPLPYS